MTTPRPAEPLPAGPAPAGRRPPTGSVEAVRRSVASVSRTRLPADVGTLGIGAPLGARRQSGARLVYEHLRAEIVSGELAPGERLTEPVQAERLGVSRTPVREALRLLQAEALVEELSTGGVRVAPLDAGDLGRVYDVRSRLEGLLARDACERATPDDVAALDRLVELMSRVAGDEAEVLRIGAEFHGVVETLAANRWCSALLRQIHGHVDRYRALAAHQRMGGTDHVTEHRAVAAAIRAGDADAAELAMRRHIDRSAALAARSLT
ncbi:GntR family transcriptional regulator [Cellulomonas sp. PhB143]|uniref:GntR family transcriptional regulator n=1 Tax=Cellulomonas sp. PhB143 TaxID=2485186 RepID=UPI000F4699AF|nr:GntR family transcriptional regulator [Cellulomonas sp. PhB143]ROS78877.1 DNA-binding GntR family transcriptional regulator [Cellulomonas sp. PhB143]